MTAPKPLNIGGAAHFLRERAEFLRVTAPPYAEERFTFIAANAYDQAAREVETIPHFDQDGLAVGEQGHVPVSFLRILADGEYHERMALGDRATLRHALAVLLNDTRKAPDE
ncbi:hypothetical protein ACFC1T_08865 [Kitasatospora sp. NPDC056076]|uniref:hypothetical protein n=1 Tax=Kitasatospora sp. NPDC056076 TaxID=3345703 RepID=UPI0035DC9B93